MLIFLKEFFIEEKLLFVGLQHRRESNWVEERTEGFAVGQRGLGFLRGFAFLYNSVLISLLIEVNIIRDLYCTVVSIVVTALRENREKPGDLHKMRKLEIEVGKASVNHFIAKRLIQKRVLFSASKNYM